jgi:hypothetical protein
MHTIAPYSEHVLICTGKDDWSSRIEDEEGLSGDFVRALKGVVGKGGRLFDVGKLSFLFHLLRLRHSGHISISTFRGMGYKEPEY